MDQRLVGPGQHVDEAGGDRESLYVNLQRRRGRVEFADSHDDIVLDGDVRNGGLAAAAVVDGASPEDHVMRILVGAGAQSEQGDKHRAARERE